MLVSSVVKTRLTHRYTPRRVDCILFVRKPCRSVPLNAGRAFALTPSTARYRWACDPALISHATD